MTIAQNFDILMADDSFDDVFFFQEALRLNAIQGSVQVFRNGHDLVDYFESRDSTPGPRTTMTLLFLSLNLAGQNGFDILRWRRTHPECRNIPVIVLSEANIERDVRLAYELGANAFLVKPTSFPRLVKVVRVTFEFWGMVRVPGAESTP